MTKNKAIKVEPWVHSLAGGCGGALGAILTNPLEVSIRVASHANNKNIN